MLLSGTVSIYCDGVKSNAKEGRSMRTDTGTELVLAETDGAVGWLTFNDPARHNTLSLAMQEAIAPVVQTWDADESVRVIVMRGAGDRAFVSGADISEFAANRTAPADRERYAARSGSAWDVWQRIHTPVIAMIDGYCIGGGLLMALQADIRICSDRSTFAIPAARLGLGYGASGVRALMQVAGPAVASDLLFSARRFSAAEALVAGLVNRCVAADELLATTTAAADEIARNAPLTIRACKAAIQAQRGRHDDDANRAVDEMVEACFRSADYLEGQAAFLAKREPVFRGV